MGVGILGLGLVHCMPLGGLADGARDAPLRSLGSALGLLVVVLFVLGLERVFGPLAGPRGVLLAVWARASSWLTVCVVMGAGAAVVWGLVSASCSWTAVVRGVGGPASGEGCMGCWISGLTIFRGAVLLLAVGCLGLLVYAGSVRVIGKLDLAAGVVLLLHVGLASVLVLVLVLLAAQFLDALQLLQCLTEALSYGCNPVAGAGPGAGVGCTHGHDLGAAVGAGSAQTVGAHINQAAGLAGQGAGAGGLAAVGRVLMGAALAGGGIGGLCV